MKTEKEEVLMYKIFKDRSGFEHKVINFENPLVCPMKGKREITSIRKTSRHIVTSSFTKITDKETGIIYGIPLGVDSKTGELKFRRIIIEDHMFFDLSVNSERELFIVLSHAPFVAKSPLAQGKPRFRIVNKEEEAEKLLFVYKHKKTAENIIESLSPVEQYDMGRNLGMAVDQMSGPMVHAELLEFVGRKARPGHNEKSGAETFLEMYENSNREIFTVINRCSSVGLIKFDPANGFVTNKGIPLGINQQQAAKYLLSNTSLLLALDQESKEKDRIISEYGQESDFKKNILEHVSKSNGQKTFVSEKEIDKAVEDLHKKNQEVEERLAKKEAKLDEMMELLRNKIDGIPSLSISEVDGTDAEYEELKNKAKKLGIKSPHMYSKENLIKKIKEAEDVLNFDTN